MSGLVWQFEVINDDRDIKLQWQRYMINYIDNDANDVCYYCVYDSDMCHLENVESDE